MRDLIAFSTRLPVRGGDVVRAAEQNFLYPVLAVLISVLVAAVSFPSFLLRPEIASLLTLLFLYATTGLMHLDGLADFFDGLLAGGSVERKVRAMKDESVGAAGVFAVFVVLLAEFVAFSSLGASISNATSRTAAFFSFFAALLVAEASAKLGMTTCIFAGRFVKKAAPPAVAPGLGALFVAKLTPQKYAGSVTVSAAIATSLLPLCGGKAFLILLGAPVAILVARAAAKNFGGVSGDVMGATNEIARACTLMAWLFA
ncbi:MAG: adenosylcobinamide-GDP ribazoletransferase [Candidatus Alkanophagales archaeon]|nr:MAG: adenosylcobinamide-GDP ribazoletransferase [Candidatus Alkanophagales archaeon]